MATMKSYFLHLLALTAVFTLLQAPQVAESLKIKKIVKDAAKLSKKYGYLLASRKKKLYAVPFPMPLPVFIKRQQIYTQIPIIPRYVQHPQHYGSPSHTYSESYEPMASSQTSPSYMEVASDSDSSHKHRSKKSATTSYQLDGSSQASSQTALSSSSGGRLNQLASILGQSVPVFGQPSGKTNRDLVTKLLNGQAKILPPTSLFSAIKGPSSALLKYRKLQQQQQQDGAGSVKYQDEESKNESQSSGGSGDQQQNSNSGGETAKTPSESSSSSTSSSYESQRPSASELHRTRQRLALVGRYSPALTSEQQLRLAMMQANPMMSPFAAMAATQVPGLVGRVPVNQLALANQYLAMLDSPQMNQFDQMDSQSSEPNELATGNPSQQQQQSGSSHGDDQANSDDQNQIIEQRQRQRLLKLALLKERQEAERLLEARLVLARARQASKQLPALGQQQTAAQLIDYYRQQQIAQQLQQMRYLQLLQQQQQLHQNSIEK